MTFIINPYQFGGGITSTYTDFKNAYQGSSLIATYPTGSLMSDWTMVSSTGVPTIYQVQSLAGSISGQAFRLQGGAGVGLYKTFTWNAVPSFADGEILAGIRVVNSLLGSVVGGAIARVGTNVTIPSKRADVTQSGAPTLFSTDSGGTDSQSITNTVTNATWYWLRARLTGNLLQGKFWLRSSAEPAGWTNTQTSSRASAAGLCGLDFNIRNTVECYFDWFSVSTDGTPAYGPGL